MESKVQYLNSTDGSLWRCTHNLVTFHCFSRVSICILVKKLQLLLLTFISWFFTCCYLIQLIFIQLPVLIWFWQPLKGNSAVKRRVEMGLFVKFIRTAGHLLHTYNPSTSRDQGRKMASLRPPYAIQLSQQLSQSPVLTFPQLP